MKTESVPPSPPNYAPGSRHPNWLDCFKSERDRLVLLPRGPESIFAYWEWTPSRTEAFRNSSLNGDLIIRLFDAEDKTQAAEFPCRWDLLKMYIKPPQGGCNYYAVLFIRTADDEFQSLLKSNTVQVPAGKPAGRPGEKPAGSSDGVPGTGYTERFKRPSP